MPIDRFKVRLRRWNLREITNGVVERACAPDAEIDLRCPDQSLNLRLNQTRRQGRRGHCDRFGQAVALIDVEDREAFEEWDGTWRFARFFGTLTFILGREAIGIDDSGSLRSEERRVG